MKSRIGIIDKTDSASSNIMPGGAVQIGLIISYHRLKMRIYPIRRFCIESVFIKVRSACLLVCFDIFTPESEVIFIILGVEIRNGKVPVAINCIWPCIV